MKTSSDGLRWSGRHSKDHGDHPHDARKPKFKTPIEMKIEGMMNKYDRDNNGLDRHEFRKVLKDMDEFHRDPLPENFE